MKTRILHSAIATVLACGLVAAAESSSSAHVITTGHASSIKLTDATQPTTAAKSDAYGKYVISHSWSENQSNTKGEHLAYVKGSPGTQMSISKSESATIEIGLALGASRSFVAGEISVSSSKTTEVTVSCQAKATKKKRYLVAYPEGTVHWYKIKSVTREQNKKVTKISKFLRAFEPKSNAVNCVRRRNAP